MEYDEEDNDATDSVETYLSSRESAGIKNGKHRGPKQTKKISPVKLSDKLQSNQPAKTVHQDRPLKNSMPKQSQQDNLTIKTDRFVDTEMAALKKTDIPEITKDTQINRFTSGEKSFAAKQRSFASKEDLSEADSIHHYEGESPEIMQPADSFLSVQSDHLYASAK